MAREGRFTPAGARRHRVTIEVEQTTTDAYSVETTTWATVATVWAAIEPVRGREQYDRQTVEADATHIITCPYLRGIRPRVMRVTEGSLRSFEILRVENVGELGRELRLEAVEKTP